MSFDKPTRNALSRMVADCRRLLTNDVREQLQATYGIQPDGTALVVDKLTHLDDRGLEIATALREWLEHLCASEAGTAEQRRTNNTDLPQEELLKRPVYVLHRAKKDPRDLKMLDPACGSGHFLLYAFDLLEHIYIEAWQDASAPASEITGKSLRDDYKTEQALRNAIPGLIMQHNLHGIDIDPRARQIAALSLWLRAQRSYQKLGLKASERPPITKINIVCAEPMPGEEDLLDGFIVKELSHIPEQEAIAHFVRQVFAKMKLAGEAGSLLKIEKDISEALTSARQQWARQSQRAQDKQGQALLFTAAEMDQFASEAATA